MRLRIRVGVAVLVAVSLALSGCGIIAKPSAGPAGSSSAAPSASPSPSPSAPSLPIAGECHINNSVEQIALSDDRADCDSVHMAETVHVGQFADAALSEPPLLDGATGAAAAAQSKAFGECTAKADAYLGHSWIHPLLALRITLPDDTSWLAGQRWYRCDLVEKDWNSSAGADAPRTGSLKTDWLGPACFNPNKDNTPQVSCSAKHPSEYVGGFMLAASVKKEPKTDKELQPYYDKCWKLVGAYTGVSAAKAESLVGVYFWWQAGPEYWPSGRRQAWCFTWTGKSTATYVTGSAKGRQGKGL